MDNGMITIYSCWLNKRFGLKFNHYNKHLEIDWLTDFNCMSTHLGLFYALRLGNRVHCTFIFTFFLCSCFLKVFLHTVTSFTVIDPIHFLRSHSSHGEQFPIIGSLEVVAGLVGVRRAYHNCYHRRKLNWQYEFKFWMRLFAFHFVLIG